MLNLLTGNGTNIQFGGRAYTSMFIMERIKYRARLDAYNELLGGKVTANEIVCILDGFVEEANAIRKGDYDSYITDEEMKLAVEDFKDRYDWEIENSYDIMMEDWFLIVHMFFQKNPELEEHKISAVQGFERLILDAIYNDGKLQNLYTNMERNRHVRKFFQVYDNIFTLNYDNNIEKLTGKEVYHLHGDFSVLSNSENVSNVQGFIREQAGERVVLDNMQHCFCSALLNYSGRLKQKIMVNNAKLNKEAETFGDKYRQNEKFRTDLEVIREDNPLEYKSIMTKIEHPELQMTTEYHYDLFKNIEGELHIIGMSPNNDAHIFDAILNNPKLEKVVFYYMNPKEKEFIEENYPKELFSCEKITEKWRKLRCLTPVFHCNYPMPKEVKQFVEIANKMSRFKISVETAIEEVNKIPQYEMTRLSKLVEADMLTRNPNHQSMTEREFIYQMDSISYIALQEGILPPVLYLVYIMNASNINGKG